MSPTTAKKRIATLHTMFPNTDLATLIKNNPNVLTENLKSLMEKIIYIHKVRMKLGRKYPIQMRARTW